MPSGASQVIGLRTWIFSRPSSSIRRAIVERDQLVFADDHLVGDRVDDVRAADAAADRVGQADLDLLAAVDHALGDALRRAAVVHA